MEIVMRVLLPVVVFISEVVEAIVVYRRARRSAVQCPRCSLVTDRAGLAVHLLLNHRDQAN